MLKKLVKSKGYAVIVLIISIANYGNTIAWSFANRVNVVQLGIIYFSDHRNRSLQTLSYVLTGLYGLDFVIKIIGLGLRNFWLRILNQYVFY